MIIKLNLRNYILLCVLFVGILNINSSSADENDKLWAKLAEGGKVVLMRHGMVNPEVVKGSSLVRDPTCKNERNLSSEGVRVAQKIGEQFREHKIQISEVQHSPFCRTTDTANLIFGKGMPKEYLRPSLLFSPEETITANSKVKQEIGSYSGAGNLVLISHDVNISQIVFQMLSQTDLLVLQPKGGDQYDELGVIKWAEPN